MERNHAAQVADAIPGHGQGQHVLLAPCFLIRSTGFPLEQLAALRMPESERRCEEALALQARIAELRGCFDQRIFADVLEREQQRHADAAVFRLWYKLNRCVYREQPCSAELERQLAERVPELAGWIAEWNAALCAAQAAQLVFEQTFDAEFQRVRANLHAIVSDERFQEALLLSSPSMYSVALPTYARHYDPARRPAKVRHLERRLYGYVQRFCAKNDTASFFGPIDYGWYAPDACQPLLFEQQPDQIVARRLTRMAFWAAQELAHVIAADPAVRPYLVPRVQDGCALLASGELFVTALNKRVRLPAELVEALRRIDGRSSMAQLFGDAGSEPFNRLVERGLVMLRITIPTAVFDPLGWLEQSVAALPEGCATRDEWLEQLGRFRQRIGDFTAAAADQKLAILQQLEGDFHALTGAEARRGEGAVYVDRLLLYDEAQGDMTACVIGPALHDDLLARLRPLCDLCASYSVLVQEVCHRRARDIFMAIDAGRPVPYLAFIRQLDVQLRIDDCLADPAVQAVLSGLNELARERVCDGAVRLAAADLRAFSRPIPAGTLISPDIFLSAPSVAALSEGGYELVVGEIHYGAQVWCHFLTFCERGDALGEWFAQALPPPRDNAARAGLMHRRQQGKTFYLELPGLSVELLGRSTKVPEQVLPVEDLEVFLDGDQLALRSRGRQQRIECYPGDPRSIANWLFCTPPVIVPPIRLGTHTPRIEIDGTTLQRARWELATAELLPPQSDAQGSAAMRHANMLRRRYGLPERCFVRVPGERKPFYVDFANAISLEFFFTMIRESSTVELSELLPTPAGSWLRRPGGTYSCEWRMTLIYGSSEDERTTQP